MLKKLAIAFCLIVPLVLIAGSLAAAAPAPTPTFTLVSGLPTTMNVGDTATVVVQVSSDQTFTFAQALTSDAYPGKGVVAVNPGARHVGSGTSATFTVTFEAKSSTSRMTNGQDTVSVVAGVRYPGGVVVSQRFDFNVAVP